MDETPPVPPLADPSLAAHTCVACTAVTSERFCPSCGEKRVDAPLRLTVILRETVGAWLALESGFLKTFVGLARRPGETIEDYLRGIRRTHCSPVRFYLWMLFGVIGAIALLDIVVPFDFTDPGFGMYPPAWMQRASRGHGAAMFTPDAMERSYRNMQSMAKVMGVVQPLAFAPAAALLFLDRRRTLAEHLVFSLYAFGLSLPISFAAQVTLRLPPWWDFWLLMPLPYLYVAWAAGRFYRTGFWMGCLRSLGAFVLMSCLIAPVQGGIAVWSFFSK